MRPNIIKNNKDSYIKADNYIVVRSNIPRPYDYRTSVFQKLCVVHTKEWCINLKTGSIKHMFCYWGGKQGSSEYTVIISEDELSHSKLVTITIGKLYKETRTLMDDIFEL